MLTDAQERAVIGYIEVSHSAKAADLLVATPVDDTDPVTLLIASGTPRADGSLVARLVVVTALDSHERIDPAETPGRSGGTMVAVLDWQAASEDNVYLLTADEVRVGHWRQAEYVATPERWRTMFQQDSATGR